MGKSVVPHWLVSVIKQERSRRLRRSRSRGRSVLANLACESLETRVVLAATPVQTFLVPITEANLQASFKTLYSGTGSTMNSVVSITAGYDGTVVYYDQWEDGYDGGVAAGLPTQTSTQIWGDNNPANGMPPGLAQDILKQGSVIALQNLVTLPRVASTLLYDGRDYIAASKVVAVTRAAWAQSPGTVLASATTVYDTGQYGTSFTVPAGQNTANSNNMFEMTALEVMAAQDGTSVTVDINGAAAGGTTTVILNRGETYRVPSGVLEGATVSTTKPVQVQMITGDIGATYSSRTFSLAPTNAWGNVYYNPIGTVNTSAPAYVFLFNPGASAISVTVQTRTGSSTVSVPAGATTRYQMPGGDTAARFSTPSSAQPFYAFMTNDSDSTNASTWDFGTRLIPESYLTTALLVSWAPGSSDLSANGSPIWVTAAAPTRVYVDYDGNRTTGAFTDPNGGKYDVAYDLVSLESKRIFNPSKNQTGMRIYTTSGVRITGVWGEDASVAGAGNPFLDMGTVIPPLLLPWGSKTFAKVGTGPIVPGDTIRYSITINNDDLMPLTGVKVFDEVPAGTTYVPNSTKVDGTPVTDQTVGGSVTTAFPLDEAGLALGTVVASSSRVVTFDVVIQSPYTGLPSGVINRARVDTDQDSFNIEVTIPPTNTPGQVMFVTGPASSAEAPNYQTNTSSFIRVTDPDPNRNPSVAETFTVVVTSPTGDSETVTVTETGPNTGIFVATLPTSTTASAVNSGTIQVLAGQTLTVSYVDPVWNFNTSTDTVPIVAIATNPPVNSVPGTQSVTQGMLAPLSTNISVADSDTNLTSTTLTVTGGILQVSLAGGATISSGANGSASLTLSGTQAQINAALGTLQYQAGYSTTTDTLSVSSVDATGLTDVDTVPIVTVATLKQLYLSNENASNTTVAGAQNLDRFDPSKTTPQPDSVTASSVVLSADTTTATLAVVDTLPATASSATASSLTISNYSTGSGANKILLVAVSIGFTSAIGTPPTVTGVTYGGIALTQGVAVQSGGAIDGNDDDVRTYIYYLLNPGSGPGNIVVSASANASIIARAITLTGAAQQAPTFASLNNVNTNTTASTTVSSATGRRVFSVASWDGPASGQTSITSVPGTTVYNATGINSALVSAAGIQNGAANVSVSYTANQNQDFAIAIAQISPGTTASGLTTTSFTQSTAMAANLTLPANQPIRVVTNVNVTSGTMPANPNITATLRYGSTTIATLTNPSFSGGVLTWGGSVGGSAVTIPAGQSVTLDITTAQTGVSFQVNYDSATAVSRIELPASPVIDVSSILVYDAPFAGGQTITSTLAGQTVYVRATITDPFGHADITGGTLLVTPSSGTPVSLTSANVVSQTGNTKVYEYAWKTASTGDFTIGVQVSEGYEGTVVDAGATTFSVVMQDTGTPSISQFTTSSDGTTTGNYAAGVNPVFVRVTDIDKNTNPSVAETIQATVTSSTGDSLLVTLTETGPSTGVFVATIATEATLTTGNSTLHAPNGSTLFITYTDPNDATDISSARALVGTQSTTVTAVNDTNTTTEDAVLNSTGTGVLANDTTSSGTIQVVAVNGLPANVGSTITLPSGASIVLRADGTYTFNPNGVYNWMSAADTVTESLPYTIRNTGGAAATATLTITITGQNDPPTTSDSVFNVPMNGTFPLSSFAFPFLDPDTSDRLQSITITTLPSAGILSLNGSPVTLNQVVPVSQLAQLLFTPAANQTGNVYSSFDYTVSDGTASSAPGKVSFIVQDSSITGSVLVDTDGNSTGDAGLAGVVLTLLDSAGNPVDSAPNTPGIQLVTAVTNASGAYSFPSVTPGYYQVRETLPSGYDAIASKDGGSPTIVGDQILIAALTGSPSTGNQFVIAVQQFAPVAVNDSKLANPPGPVTLNVTANDVDANSNLDIATVDLDPATAGRQTSFTKAGEGTWSVDATGLVTFTPLSNFKLDPTPIQYTVSDTTGLVSNQATITIDYVPVASDDTSAGNTPGSAVTVAVLSNDNSGDTAVASTVKIDGTVNAGDPLVVSGQGTWSVNTTTGAITFTPTAGFKGNPTPIRYTVNDAQGNTSNLATVTVTYAQLPPVAANDTSLANPPGVVLIHVAANDTDPNDNIDVMTIDLDPGTAGQQTTRNVAGEGTWALDPGNPGHVNFTPLSSFKLDPTPIQYTISDSTGLVSNAATITIDYVPLATNDDSLNNPTGAPVTVEVLANDTSGDTTVASTVKIVGASGAGQSLVVPGQGTWTVNATTGAITFTPTAGYTGDPTPIQYTVQDVQGNTSNAATVAIDYDQFAPTAVNDAKLSNLAGPVSLNVTGNDTDANGDLDVATVDLDPATAGRQTTFTKAGEGTWTVDDSGNVTFTPLSNFKLDPTPIRYTVSDKTGLTSNQATITVDYDQLAPVAVNDAKLSNPAGPVSLNVTANDVDANEDLDIATVDLDPATAGRQTTFTKAGEGTWTVDDSGNVTFTPLSNFKLDPTPIPYTVSDSIGLVSNQATITIDYVPVASDDSSTGNTPGSAVTVAVLTNDTDGDSVVASSVKIVGASGTGQSLVVPGQGTWSVNVSSGAIKFTPLASYKLEPTPIQYTVNDAQGNTSNPATVTVDYVPIVTNDSSAGNTVGTSVTVNVLANDTSGDSIVPGTVKIVGTTNAGDPLVVPSQGTWSINPTTGAITFTPLASFTGDPTPIQYTAQDAQGNTSTPASVTVIYLREISSSIQPRLCGVTYNRSTRLYNGVMRLTNTGTNTYSGKLKVVFLNLTPGITITGASIDTDGNQYMVFDVLNLGPGTFADMAISYSNPLNKSLSYTLKTYTGAF